MEQPGEINIPVSWIGLDEAPIIMANQFLIQHEPNQFVLTIGQLGQPVLIGTPEEQAEQAQQLEFVGIKTLARLAMSPTKLRELIAVLQTNLEKHDSTLSDMDPTQGT